MNTVDTFFQHYKFGIKEKLILFRYSIAFDIITSSVIILYAIILGTSTLEISQKYSAIKAILSILDYSISLFFLFELALRIYSEEKFINFFKDKWNIFDFIVITMSLIPLEIFNIAALARIIRIFRILRLITVNEELKRLIDVLFYALPSIFNITILMFVITYIYAIIGTSFFAKVNPELWGDIGKSMLTLFRVLTFEGWTEVMYETQKIYPLSWIYYISYIIFNGFIVFNLFVAVIIDEINKTREIDFKNFVSQEDLEASALKIMNKIDRLEEKIEKLMEKDV